MDVDHQPPWVSDLLADIDRNPSARITEWQLSQRGIDPATVRRHFLKHYGMYVIEVNAVPGWQALSEVSGADVAEAIIDYVFQVVSG